VQFTSIHQTGKATRIDYAAIDYPPFKILPKKQASIYCVARGATHAMQTAIATGGTSTLKGIIP